MHNYFPCTLYLTWTDVIQNILLLSRIPGTKTNHAADHCSAEENKSKKQRTKIHKLKLIHVFSVIIFVSSFQFYVLWKLKKK